MADISLETLDELAAASAGRDPVPKYERLSAAFAAAIRSGRFRPGERVPTEAELADRLPVSLGTVQKALGKLADSGLIVRNRKTGTFIADRRTRVDEVYAYRFVDPDSGEVMLPFLRVLKVEPDCSPGPWKTALRASRMVRIDRLVWFDQDPPAFSSVYLAHRHGEVFLDVPVEQLHGSSTHRIIIERFNLPTLRTEHRLSCRELSAEACSHLRLPAGSVGIEWDIRDYAFDETPFLFQRFQLPPGHRPLELTERFAP